MNAHRQLLAVGVTIAGALLATAPPAIGAAKPNPRCTGQLVAAQGPVKIVLRGIKSDSFDRRSYICWHDRQTAAVGDSRDETGGVGLRGKLQIAGRWVAYALRASGGDLPASYTISIVDARSGRKTRVPATLSPSSTFDLPAGVRRVVLTPAGSVAWTIDKDPVIAPSGNLPSGDFSLYTLPAGTRAPTLIASGTGLDPDSLAVAPGRIYWISDGAPMSAAVP